MGKNWAITIGINQYHNLQDLRFAERDANAMSEFFLDELNSEQVYSFTTHSPPIVPDYGPPMKSQPTYGILKRFLRVRFEQSFLEAGDNFWFFFAGHGIRYQERDYLMPVDGDPGDVATTAIAVSYVTERLRRCGADNIILLIDACRSQGKRTGVGVGRELQQGIISLFSCSPTEASYEIEQIGQGAFTRALLEGLRLQGDGNCATVERLYQYLRVQVPTLNRRYDKPKQTPYGAIEPPSKYHLILLPQRANVKDVMILKKDALTAEIERDVQLAKQYWIRVLTAAPGDAEAIAGIERLARPATSVQAPGQTMPASLIPVPERSTHTAPSVLPKISPAPQASSSSPGHLPAFPVRLSRRRFVQIACGAGGAIALGWGISHFSSNNSSRDRTVVSRGDEVKKSFSFEVVAVDDRGNITKRRQKKAKGFAQSLGDDIHLKMVSIPGGNFVMGSPEQELEKDDSEGPPHPVAVPSFFIGQYLVTQAQWKAVAAFPKVERSLESNPAQFKGDDRPVENISWLDAMEFCARLSQKTERQYRLPSEAEWEYACRAGTTTPFHFGETITTALANYDGDLIYGNGPKGKDREETTPVGRFGVANAFGLYDMHGNVSEWCADRWHQNYHGAPTDGSAWMNNKNDKSPHLLRGGAWVSSPRGCRSAYRKDGLPTLRKDFVGLRVACSDSQ